MLFLPRIWILMCFEASHKRMLAHLFTTPFVSMSTSACALTFASASTSAATPTSSSASAGPATPVLEFKLARGLKLALGLVLGLGLLLVCLPAAAFALPAEAKDVRPVEPVRWVSAGPEAEAPTLDLAPEDLPSEDLVPGDLVPGDLAPGDLGSDGRSSEDSEAKASVSEGVASAVALTSTTSSVDTASSAASTARAQSRMQSDRDGERNGSSSGRTRVASDEDSDVLLKGLEPMRRAQDGTVVGGYGQLDLTSRRVGPRAERFDVRGTVRRLVLFVSHHLTEDISIYTEFEWENAIACASCRGSVEVEQVTVDWKLIDSILTLRSGLVLVPMGIINQWHEPPVFNGVERPSFDGIIIPSTWRELAIGATGRFADFFTYELYVMTPLDPTALGPGGLAGARGQGSFASSRTPAVSGRIEAEPLLGLIAGASFYASDLGTNGDFFDASGARIALRFPIFGYALDARYKGRGFEARAVWSQWFTPNAEDLLRARRADGSLWFPNATQTGPVPMRAEGGYVELGYDVLRLFTTSRQALVVFGRVEHYSTQAKVPSVFARNPSLVVMEYTYGLSYRPIPQLVLKFDTQLRDREKGLDELAVDAGLGFMF